MDLRRFSAALGAAEVVDRAPVEVRDLAYDTRSVAPGALFFCVRGASTDGHDLAPAAVAAGAAALVVERRLEVAVPQLVVPNVRKAMPAAAVLFFGDPTRELEVAGITGTNGKTTTAFLLHSILTVAGRRPGLLTNIERRVGGTTRATGLNTPEAIDLQRLFREMLDAGDTSCVIEATSIAQAKGRLDGTRFGVLAFTNLTQDHLDFHGSMDAYFAAKRALFDQAERAVVNVGDEYGRLLAAERPDAVVFDESSAAEVFERNRPEAPRRVQPRERRGRCAARASARRPRRRDPSWGRARRRDPGTIRGGRRGAAVRGASSTTRTARMRSRTPSGGARTRAGRLIVVFGAGGDRDRDKRPLMGALLGTGQSRDRHVRQSALRGSRRDRRRGRRGRERPVDVELDRRAAIERAFEAAEPGDVVVIAGKGARVGQELATVGVPFDDREVARMALRRLAARA